MNNWRGEKFEYLVVDVDATDYDDEFLNSHGQDGWELVSVENTTREEYSEATSWVAEVSQKQLTFKRSLQRRGEMDA